MTKPKKEVRYFVLMRDGDENPWTLDDQHPLGFKDKTNAEKVAADYINSDDDTSLDVMIIKGVELQRTISRPSDATVEIIE